LWGTGMNSSTEKKGNNRLQAPGGSNNPFGYVSRPKGDPGLPSTSGHFTGQNSKKLNEQISRLGGQNRMRFDLNFEDTIRGLERQFELLNSRSS